MTDITKLRAGDRVYSEDYPKDDWIIASLDRKSGIAVIARLQEKRTVHLDRLVLARTRNKPSDTPVRQRNISEF